MLFPLMVGSIGAPSASTAGVVDGQSVSISIGVEISARSEDAEEIAATTDVEEFKTPEARPQYRQTDP